MTHTDQDNQTFDTMEKPAPIPSRMVRKPTRFEIWAWSPVISFQIGLTAGYIGMIYFGVTTLVTASPTFYQSAPAGWSLFWSLALILGGLIGGLGSVHRSRLFQRMELFGAAIVSLTVGSYAALILGLSHVLDELPSHAMGAGLVALVIPTVVRTLWLASQSLRK